MSKVLVLLMLISLFLTSSANIVYSTNDHHILGNNEVFYFIIYGSSGCLHCINMKNFLTETYGSHKVLFMDAYTNRDAYERLQALIKQGIPGGVPLTFIIYNNTVSCAIQGEFMNKEFIENELVTNNKNEFIIYTPSIAGVTPVKIISYRDGYTHKDFINFLSGSSLRIDIEVKDITTQSVSSEGSRLLTIAPLLIILALIDSINPCTFALYTSFTVSCMSGKKIERGPPLLFIKTIYIGYLLFGLGLSYVAYTLGRFKSVFFAIALALGIVNVFSAGRFGLHSLKCKWCDRLRLNPRFFKNKYLLALMLSLFSIVFLLPCTSGPLIAFSAIISGYELPMKITMLIVYNVVFISPLVAIYILLRTVTRVKKITKWIEENSGVLEFLTGVMLIMIALILIATGF